MPVRFPTAVRQVELNRAADSIAPIDPNRGVGKIRAGFAIPNAELNDLDLLARDRGKAAAEIAGKPARLQFEFAWGAQRRKERALTDTRGVTKLGVVSGKLHLGGGP